MFFSPETVRDVCLFPTLYCSSAASLEHNDGDEEVRSNLRRKISNFISSSDERDVLSFPSSLTAAERKIVHEVNRLAGVPRYSSLCWWRALSNVVILCMLFKAYSYCIIQLFTCILYCKPCFHCIVKQSKI